MRVAARARPPTSRQARYMRRTARRTSAVRWPTISESGSLTDHTAIRVSTAEPEAQGAGEGGLGPAGVGAFCQRSVAAGGGQGRGGVFGTDGGGERCEAGREEVDQVIQAGGGPSEILVGRVRVADH